MLQNEKLGNLSRIEGKLDAIGIGGQSFITLGTGVD